MRIWRPKKVIEVKALGLVWRRGRLLAREISRGDGSVKGVRPLGGRPEFCGTWRTALVREFWEALKGRVDIIGDPIFLESIYTHPGAVGYEMGVLSDVLFPDVAHRDHEVIEYHEDNGAPCRARWYDCDHLDRGGLALCPRG